MTDKQAENGKQKEFKSEDVTDVKVEGKWEFSIGKQAIVTVKREDKEAFKWEGTFSNKPKPTARHHTEYSIEYLDKIDKWGFGAVVSFRAGKVSVSPMEDGSQGFDPDYTRYPALIVPGDFPFQTLIEPKGREVPIKIEVTEKEISIAYYHVVPFPEDVLRQIYTESRRIFPADVINLERKD